MTEQEEREERERFPLGKPVNRQEPAKPKPERQEHARGIFSIDGMLQTDLPITGPRHGPLPSHKEHTA